MSHLSKASVSCYVVTHCSRKVLIEVCQIKDPHHIVPRHRYQPPKNGEMKMQEKVNILSRNV